MTICERLFKELETQGKHAADLCKVLGIRTSVTTGWKNRNTDPPAKYIIPIANFLGVSVDYLLTGKDNQSIALISPSSRNETELLATYRRLSIYAQSIINKACVETYSMEQNLTENLVNTTKTP